MTHLKRQKLISSTHVCGYNTQFFLYPRPLSRCGNANCQRPPAWRRPRKTSAVRLPDASASCTLNTDGPLETPADSPASDVADVLTNQSADTRAQGQVTARASTLSRLILLANG